MRSELFEETLKQHKDSLTDELVQLGKHRQAQLAEWDIEQNESDYEFYFNAAWNTQQSKVDELQVKLSGAEERALTCLEYKDKYRAERDELQKRMNEIIQQSKDFIRSCKNDAEIFEDTNAAGKAYGAEAVVELLEQALKGGGE